MSSDFWLLTAQCARQRNRYTVLWTLALQPVHHFTT